MWVGLIQSGENLNRTKKADPPPSKGEFLLLYWLQTGTLAFSCLQTRAETSALPVLRSLDSNWNYTIGSSGSQFAESSCRPWDLSASVVAWANSLSSISLSLSVSLSLSIHTHTYKYTHIPLVLFLCRTLTNTSFLRSIQENFQKDKENGKIMIL